MWIQRSNVDKQRTSRMKVKGAVWEGTAHNESTPQATSTRHLHIFLAEGTDASNYWSIMNVENFLPCPRPALKVDDNIYGSIFLNV